MNEDESYSSALRRAFRADGDELLRRLISELSGSPHPEAKELRAVLLAEPGLSALIDASDPQIIRRLDD